MQNKISAVIITLNEEKNIGRCLASLEGIADEIIVVDSGSTDKTAEICAKHQVKFIYQKWLGYGKQKNFAAAQAENDYILSLDADEELSEQLRDSILRLKSQQMASAYMLNRLTSYCGQWIYHCGWYPDRKIRLWKKDKASWTTPRVHETIKLSPEVTPVLLQGDLLHYTYYTIGEHIAVANKYTTLVAQEYAERGKKASWVKLFLNPPFAFFRDYILKLGILDGFNGFIICCVNSFMTFLKYAKLRQIYAQKKTVPKSISLIVTTYNWPQALELVLRSIKQQTVLPNEVIIADDGSTKDTGILIELMQGFFPVPLIHSWQEDKGFRAARSRNLAFAKAKGEYIIMIDGDMILHPNFIRDHKNAAQTAKFVQGRRVILTEKLSKETLVTKNIRFSFFSEDVKNKMNAISCPLLSKFVSERLSKQSHMSIRSANMAVWRADLLKVNGFNDDFEGWGREDSEFAVRLLNSGIKRYDLRLGGVAYHLYHNENSKQNLPENDKILVDAVHNKSTYCEHGLKDHL